MGQSANTESLRPSTDANRGRRSSRTEKTPQNSRKLIRHSHDQGLSSGSGSSKLAIRALQILLFAYRPFAWAEFLYPVALSDSGIQPGVTKDGVLHSTCNFIYEDPAVDRVAFPNLSVREYLETRPEFKSSALHIAASQICLNDIRYPGPRGNWSRGFTYAVLYIGNHLAELSTMERKQVKLLEQFILYDPPLICLLFSTAGRYLSRPMV